MKPWCNRNSAWMLLAVLLVGCAGSNDGDTGGKIATAPAPSSTNKTFLADNQAWRETRQQQLRKPDGWTSLVGLHWLEPGSQTIGSGVDSSLRLAVGPAALGEVSGEGEAFWFTPAKGVAMTVDGQPLTGKIRFYSDRDEHPNKLGFDGGKGLLALIQRGDRRALRVWHADAPSRLQFSGLDYWPADPDWRITGRYVANAEGKTLPIVDIIGVITEQPNAGAIEFERAGRRHRLEAIGKPGSSLFVVFADRSNGHGSYPAGRFVEVAAPDASGNVTIDFNRAYNPPCAFTPFATCPLPPPENRLDLVVSAGEKNYHKAP